MLQVSEAIWQEPKLTLLMAHLQGSRRAEQNIPIFDTQPNLRNLYEYPSSHDAAPVTTRCARARIGTPAGTKGSCDDVIMSR